MRRLGTGARTEPVSSVGWRWRCAMVAVVVGCGPGREPEDPADYFQAGADPAALVEEAIRAYESSGFAVRTRLSGPGFEAFDAVDDDGQTRLRVATTRGWALAIDAPSATHLRRWVRLGERLVGGAMVISAPDAVRGFVCSAIVDIREGRAIERRTDFAPFGASGCVLSVEPDHLDAVLFYEGLGRGVVPTVRVRMTRGTVLSAVPTSDGDTPAARAARAVEEAASAFLRGEEVSVQHASFGAGSDCTASPEWCAEVRQRIDAGWRDPQLAPEDAGP